MVNNKASLLLEGLFPNHCCLCGWRCAGNLPLCEPCRNEMPLNESACDRCALPLASPAARLCGACLRRPPAFDRVIAPWLYGEYLAHILQRWKFHRDTRLTRLLADMWQQQVSEVAPVDAAVPVPMHWWRQWRRGYNQAELLALALRRHRPQLTIASRLLCRHRHTRAQSGMTARARSRNLRGAFTAGNACANLRLAVIDDVLTTGATAQEVAQTLKDAGATYVEIWCLARTPPPGD